jgi:hypothetical protein
VTRHSRKLKVVRDNLPDILNITPVMDARKAQVLPCRQVSAVSWALHQAGIVVGDAEARMLLHEVHGHARSMGILPKIKGGYELAPARFPG